jgi:uncharacterized membrane protein YoaK (UPF0700 family)
LFGRARVAWKGTVSQGPSTRWDYRTVAAGVLVGAVCGTALALILDNVAFGVCVGVIIGVASANAFKELLRFADYTRDRDQD